MEFCIEDMDKHGDRVFCKINAFIRNCLAHPTAVRKGIREEGVAVVLRADVCIDGITERERLAANEDMHHEFDG